MMENLRFIGFETQNFNAFEEQTFSLEQFKQI